MRFEKSLTTMIDMEMFIFVKVSKKAEVTN